MCKGWVSRILLFVLVVSLLGVSAFAEKVYVSSTGIGQIYLRTEPDTEHGSNGTVSHGEEVTVGESRGEWTKVTVKGTTRTGWVKTKYIDGTTEALGTGTRKIVADSDVPVYTDSNSSSKRKGFIKPGSEFKILNTQGDWVRIQSVANGVSGWIEFKYVEVRAGENFSQSSSSSGSVSSGSQTGSLSTGGNSSSVSEESVQNNTSAFVDANDPNTYYVCHVSVASLSIRAEANKKSEELTTLSSESVVKVLDSTNDKWYKVQTVSGIVGYASADCLDNYATAKLSGANLNLRAGPSTETDVVIAVKDGRPVIVDEICGEWAHVMVNGNRGYMLLDYLSFDGN